MLVINVKDGESIERALKKYKKKYDKVGIMKQLRARQQYIKKSVLKRQIISKAKYRQQKYSAGEI